MSRINNSIKNSISSMGGQLLTLILGYVSRSIFIKTLGAQYLGISGLFTNIISILSLSELGIGTAIIFNMYKPLAENDKHRIYILMKFYKTSYRIIGLAITILGCVLMPFLSKLIKSPPEFINLYLVFTLFLLQSVSSYFFYAYKSSLLRADQKAYIVTIIGYYFTLISNLIQIACLIIFKNYYYYLVIMILTNIIQNIVIARKNDAMYPYVNEKSNDKLTKSEMKEILKNCYALTLYQANYVVITATDNLVLSMYIGLDIVGKYSNYTLLTGNLKRILSMVFNSFNASLGNLHADTKISLDKEVTVFFVANFISALLYGICAIGISVVANQFIEIWIGKVFILPQTFVLLLSIDLYFYGLQKVTALYRSTMGLFQQAKYRPLAGAIINIVVSIVLVVPLGINGVLIGTISAGLLTYSWFDPFILFEHGFNRSPLKYYMKNIQYLIIIVCSGLLTYVVAKVLPFHGLSYILIAGSLSILIPCIMFIICFGKTDEFHYICSVLKFVIERRKVNNAKSEVY